MRNNKIDKKELIFQPKALVALLTPIIIEQLLNSLMGMTDTMMVSNVGKEVLSAVSLVDSINNLVIQLFSAMATGATILCSQYIGSKNYEGGNRAARQVVLTVLVISLSLTVLGLGLRKPLLSLIFGQIEPDVMGYAQVYFFVTALSYPFVALFNAGSALFRASGNSRYPMRISVISNGMNIAGNAILIFGFGMGALGAALSTLVSRIFCTVVVFAALRKPRQCIVVDGYFYIRPQWNLIAAILAIGIPSGVENSMFQFGKLAIQSTVSTMGTTAISAQAMTNILESVNGIFGIGVGIGLMTVVGQCIGAGRPDQARYYILRLTAVAEVGLTVSCLLVYAAAPLVTRLAGMDAESAALCLRMVGAITVVKPLTWTLSFVPVYGMRGAGDVKFSMLVSSATMWCMRVALCIYLVRTFQMGPMAVWYGMFADWTLRGIIFSLRFFSGKWVKTKLVG